MKNFLAQVLTTWHDCPQFLPTNYSDKKNRRNVIKNSNQQAANRLSRDSSDLDHQLQEFTMKTQDELLISPREAAKRLSVSDRKLWSMTFEHQPGLPYVRCGRLVRYCPGDLQRWIDSQRQGGQNND